MKLTIYHTNDIHSSFTGLAQAASYLRHHRRSEDLYFDCGDLCDLKDITVQGTGGKGAIRLMKQAGADAMAIGNNEIDLEHDALTACSREGLPLISCNVVDNDGNMIGNINKSLIIERAGVRFLLIGISPYYAADRRPNAYNLFFQMGNIMTIDPLPQIQQEIELNKGKYDFCILLSHSGLATEEWFLEQLPEIDLCLGGHSHSLCSSDRYSQAGGLGQHLGAVHLTIEGQKVVNMTTETIEMTMEPDKDMIELWKQQEQLALECLDKTLYEVGRLQWDVEKENLLTNFIADALYANYPCELAFINSGIVEGEIEGRISKKLLIELSPSKLNPTRFPVSGRQLKQAILHALDSEFVHQSGKGAGVRGKVLGTLGFSHNVRIQRNPFEILINGDPLSEDRAYVCMADDSLQRGTGYTELATDDTHAEFFRGFIRDLLERTLNDPEILKSAHIQRILD